MDSTVEICLNSTKRKAIRIALASTKACLENTLGSFPPKSREFTGIKKSLTIVLNTVSGMLDGIVNEDLTRKEFKVIASNLQNKLIFNFGASVSADLSAAAASADAHIELAGTQEEGTTVSEELAAHISKSADYKEALAIIKEEMKQRKERARLTAPTVTTPADVAVDSDSALIATLERMQASKARMPLKLRSEYSIFKFPVIPIFNSDNTKARSTNPMSISPSQKNYYHALAKLGLQVTKLQDYVILEEQLLLAFNRKSLRVTSKQQLKPIDYARMILKVINEKSPTPYVLVSDTFLPSVRNSDIIMFWILPGSLLSAMISKGWSKLKEWGFAFQN